MILLLENAIKMALIVLFALALMPILRNRAAALRHWVLAAGLVCAAVSPLARFVVPTWSLRVGMTPHDATVGSSVAGAAVETSFVVPAKADWKGDARAAARPAPLPWDGLSVTVALRAIWIGGAAVGFVVLLFGLGRLHRLASRARRVSEGIWIRCAEDIRREYRLRPVTLLLSDHSTLLVTWGVRHPRVLLPAGADGWCEDRVRLVLLHELAHIARGDWIVQLAAELMRALYWFNPLIWIASRRLRQESERACDDAVINRGIEGADYATHLVDIARELQRRPAWVPAPSIARTSSLERRVRAMLDAGVNRRPISRSACAAALLALLTFATPVTGIALAQAVLSTVAGSIVDPTNGAVPGVTVVLTNEQSKAKYEVRSDQGGRYEFVAVAAGDYLLEARLAGFATLRSKLSVGGQNVQRDLTLQVGTLEETITVRDKPGSSAAVAVNRGSSRPRPSPRNVADCTPPASSSGTLIGGSIRPPWKLVDARPQYPAGVLNSGISGQVVLKARIGTDGTVTEVNVVSAPHADLANAAVEAVRQWEFDSTLLNCVPIEVNIDVRVNFELER